MNFLAHLYLSGSSEDIMLGNFIGDFVKGHKYEKYSPGIREGILLHRRIDDFTDHHEIVSNSKDILRDKYRHYSGVIVDMFYDHFLARFWPDFSQRSLPEFTREVYGILQRRREEMPRAASHMLTYMAADNWLLSYASREGIHQALSGMARRTSFKSHMEEAVTDLEANYEAFHEQFNQFFPVLAGEVAQHNPAFSPPEF